MTKVTGRITVRRISGELNEDLQPELGTADDATHPEGITELENTNVLFKVNTGNTSRRIVG